MKLSIILPVKNEPLLPELLNKLTHTVYGDLETFIQTEKGLGYAVQCGLKRCSGDIIVIMDSDGSHPVEAIPEMLKLLDSADIVIGSRYTSGGKNQDAFKRRVISKIYCAFAKTLFSLNVKDCMSGFIVAKKEVFDNYPISNNGFKIGLELLFKSKHTYKTVEYPITFTQRKMGKSKADSKEAINTLIFMLRLKTKDIF